MIEVNVESLNHEGRGITHIEGKTVFIDGALPNETVLAIYTKRHRRYDEAKVVEIKNASPFRVTPPCEHFSICGGCDLQHLDPDQQLLLKQQTLLEQFKHFGNLTPEEILPPLTGPTLEYRHKARLGVKYVTKKQKVLIGFHEKDGRYIADLSNCKVLPESFSRLFEPLRELISGLSIYNKLAQIEVAIDNKNVALILRHIADLSENDKAKILEFGKTHNVHLYLEPNKPNKVTRLWPESGSDLLSYRQQNIDFYFHPKDFTQINPDINRKMVSLALDLLSPSENDHILDLFCGLGNFTLPLAKYSKYVTGIEGDQTMIERANANAEFNQLSHANFICSNLFEPNPGLTWMKQTYNKILLDPPRTGALEIIKEFPRFKPEKILYISCNPATLARDAGELVNQQGYRLIKAGVMDMFPHTKHVESIALFILE